MPKRITQVFLPHYFLVRSVRDSPPLTISRHTKRYSSVYSTSIFLRLTGKELLLKYKDIAAEFLNEFYEKGLCSFCPLINNFNSSLSTIKMLINSENYVTRRQSLKLLSDILLERENFSVMKRFVDNPANLKTMMNLLRDRSRNIQFEAFHVFKVFCSKSTQKTDAVHDILQKNKERMISFLMNFQNDREGKNNIRSKEAKRQMTISLKMKKSF